MPARQSNISSRVASQCLTQASLKQMLLALN